MYKFVHIGKKRDDDDLYQKDHFYPYTLFIQLMKKLEAESMEKKMTFWFNRQAILRHAKDLVIVVDYPTQDIVAFHVISPRTGEIKFFQVFQEGKGIGRMLIERALATHGTLLHVVESLPEAVGFWERMGIRYDVVSHV